MVVREEQIELGFGEVGNQHFAGASPGRVPPQCALGEIPVMSTR
jgi:hypothetical protein